ncbi:MAG TPA: hypothetical protein VGI90_00055 [Steroidobacteraceae bacterium]|jgi:hypothetical protein
MAVFAFAFMFQVNRRAALRAGNLTHLRANSLKLRSGQATDELLLSKKLEEGRESSAVSVAREIRKPAALAQVEVKHKGIAAAWATQGV